MFEILRLSANSAHLEKTSSLFCYNVIFFFIKVCLNIPGQFIKCNEKNNNIFSYNSLIVNYSLGAEVSHLFCFVFCVRVFFFFHIKMGFHNHYYTILVCHLFFNFYTSFRSFIFQNDVPMRRFCRLSKTYLDEQD